MIRNQTFPNQRWLCQNPEIVEPNDNYVPKSNIPEPKLYIPKPSNDKLDYEYSLIGIEGLVLCKQGSNYTPLFFSES
jgi:hypothetical protein